MTRTKTTRNKVNVELLAYKKKKVKQQLEQHQYQFIKTSETGYIVNIDKPVKWTSFDVVKKIRNFTKFKKVGHAGTLDPFATGVLLICLGKATKLSSELMNLPKEYITEISLGKTTDTLDITGTVIQEKPVPEFSEEEIKSILRQFHGKIKQRIPDFSAAQVNGKRLYKLAREGKSIPEIYKDVEIHQIELLECQSASLRIRVVCGSGTYIRMLGADIANKLNTVGHLRSLRRTRIGEYTGSRAMTIETFENIWQNQAAYENISHN